ncbi:MAG: hypothetical protein ACR2KJ_00840 [Jatrophihabitans sp.]
MTTTDWAIDIALILIVLRQLRVGQVDFRFVLIPLALCYFAAKNYFHGLPTAGNDLVLIGAFGALGLTLGIAGGLWTRVWSDGSKHARVQAGPAAAGLWIGSMAARLGFIYWITHSGGGALVRFSTSHHLTGADVWSTALIVLALSEVGARMAVIVFRAYRTMAATSPQRTPVYA